MKRIGWAAAEQMKKSWQSEEEGGRREVNPQGWARRVVPCAQPTIFSPLVSGSIQA